MTWDDAEFRAAIERTLQDFLDQQATVLAPLGPDAERLIDQARICVSGGKRLRAAFCWWGHQAIRRSAPNDAALLQACAALELLHASALVHDDYMDGSDTRRGRPAAHLAFAEQHRGAGWPGAADGFGAAAAILLGDLLLVWAEQLLRTSALANPEALGLFDLCRTEVIAGQFLDVSVQARGRADVTTAMTVLRYKSAKYSVERPLHIGAALAGADNRQLDALTRFGLPIGEAFQLRDDQLGVFGNPAQTGKPAGDDLVEGKRTVLVALALDGGDDRTRTEIEQALGRDLSPAEVDQARDAIAATGADEQVEEAIAGLTDQALSALAESGLADDAVEVLRSLAVAATVRTT